MADDDLKRSEEKTPRWNMDVDRRRENDGTGSGCFSGHLICASSAKRLPHANEMRNTSCGENGAVIV